MSLFEWGQREEIDRMIDQRTETQEQAILELSERLERVAAAVDASFSKATARQREAMAYHGSLPYHFKIPDPNEQHDGICGNTEIGSSGGPSQMMTEGVPLYVATLTHYLRLMGIRNIEPHQIVSFDVKRGIVIARSAAGTSAFLVTAELKDRFLDALLDYFKGSGQVDQALRLANQIASLGTAATPSPEEEPAPMSDKPTETTTLESAKEYGAEVAYWTTAMQLTKRARGLLADALTQHLKGKARATKRQMVLELLEGPAGVPIVALVASGLLPRLAALFGQEGPRVTHLAEIMRLHAGVSAANDLADKMFEFMLPAKEALTQAFTGLPDVPALNESKRRDVLDLETERAKVGSRPCS